jgi:hypothetical protein
MCPVYVFSILSSCMPILKRFKVEFDMGHEATDGTPLQSVSSLIPPGRIARGFCSDRRAKSYVFVRGGGLGLSTHMVHPSGTHLRR